ncbi:MAG: hypothetical protein GWP03_03160, partial [Proteobacteria bacterium]|nr:hypothetical protein [Pseudomonadota bacterium]
MFKKIYSFLILLLLTVVCLQASEKEIGFGKLNITPFRNFSKISLKRFHFFSGSGIPMIPYKDTLIPVTKGDKSIKYTVIDSCVYENITIAPSQKTYPTNSISIGKFSFDSVAYNSQKVIPDRLVNIEGYGKIRGRLYAKVLISPFRYYPSDKKLVYYDKINLTTPDVKSYSEFSNDFPGI